MVSTVRMRGIDHVADICDLAAQWKVDWFLEVLRGKDVQCWCGNCGWTEAEQKVVTGVSVISYSGAPPCVHDASY